MGVITLIGYMSTTSVHIFQLPFNISYSMFTKSYPSHSHLGHSSKGVPLTLEALPTIEHHCNWSPNIYI